MAAVQNPGAPVPPAAAGYVSFPGLPGQLVLASDLEKLRKDEEAGKETFLSLLGAERAREQCALLVDQAIDHLRGFGDEADLLRAIARYVVDRDH